MNLDGTDKVRLTALRETGEWIWVYHPRWFPDGDRLVFTTHEDVYVIDADGSGLTKMPYNLEYPTISPDGKRIAGEIMQNKETSNGTAFVTDDLQIMDLDGQHVLSLTNCNEDDPCSLAGLSWSPDGEWVAFGMLNFEQPGIDIYVERRDGSERKRVTFLEHALMPSWSPDGERIAFMYSTIEGSELYMMKSDGSDLRPLDLGGIQLLGSSHVAWSPDSKKIAVSAIEENSPGTMYVLDADGRI